MAQCVIIGRKRRHKHLKPIIVILIIIVLLLLYYYLRILPIIYSIAEEKTRMKVSESIDEMADMELNNITYQDLVTLGYNETGYVSIVRVNSVLADMLARNITSRVRKEMSTYEDDGVDISLGALTGVTALSGVGPKFKLYITNLGVVDADFSSEFISAGINQTIHRLYMQVMVDMNIVLPGNVRKITNSSEIIIAESIIVGEVPKVYLSN